MLFFLEASISLAVMTTFPIRCLESLQNLSVMASNYRLQRYLSYNTMLSCINTSQIVV
jgi:hypothetical protein